MSTTTSAALKDIAIGNIVYVDITIDKADMADPNSASTTAKKIKKGDKVTRLCIVLEKTDTSLTVTYLATFAGAATLPTSFTDKSMWYPVTPATKESTYEPLPQTNGKAQWACLRKKQVVTTDPVKKASETMTEASAKLILAAMKA